MTILRARSVARSMSLAAPVVSEDDLLGDRPPRRMRNLVLQELLGVVVLFVFRQLLGQAEGHSARNDGDLVQRIASRNQNATKAWPASWMSRNSLFLFA